MRLSVLAVVFTIITMAVFSSCEKEVTPPALKVVSVSIPNNTEDIEINATISITCDRDIDPVSVNASTIKIVDKNNNSVPTVLTCSGKNISFYPKTGYMNATTYTVSLSSVKAKDGGLLTSHSFSFTTKKAPFTIVSITPTDGSTSVDLNAEIKLVFNRDVDQSSVNSNNIKIVDQNNKNASVTFTCDGKNVSIRPTTAFAEGSKYKISVEGVKTQDGVVISNSSFSFTTKSLPFYVVEVKPSGDLVDIELNKELTILFNKDVDKNTVTSKNITVVDQNNNSASVTFSCNGKSVSIVPASLYAGGSKYTITISGVKSVDGISVDKFTFSFTTKKTPFSVVSTTPTDGSINIELNTEVKILFNKDIDKNTVNSSNVKVVDQNNNTASMALTCDGKSVSIRPTSAYAEGMKYTVSISGLKATDGVSMDSFTSSFTTKRTPFTVVSITPASGSVDVALNTEIKILFNKDVDKSTVTSNNVRVVDNKSNDVAVVLSCDGKSLSIRPASALTDGAVYTVSVSGLKSTDGAVVESFSSSFLTKKLFTVVSATPANGSTNVELDAEFKILFNRDVDITTVHTNNIKVYDQDGLSVSIIPTCNGNSVSIRPAEMYKVGKKYTVSISGLRSSDGAEMLPFTSTFTTKSTPFTVVSTTPANNATGVDVTTTVKIVFNKEVDRSTLENGIKLFLAGGTQFAVDFGGSGNEVTFTKRGEPLPAGAKFTVNIEGLKAVDGTTIESTSFSFTTKEAPLTVYSTSPANGATNVPLNATITVEFSKLLNCSGLKGSDIVNMTPLSDGVGSVTYYVTFDNARTFTITPSDLKPNCTYLVYIIRDVVAADGDKYTTREIMRFTTGSK